MDVKGISISSDNSVRYRVASPDEVKKTEDNASLKQNTAASQVSKEELGQVTEELNKFMRDLNTTIQFKLHEKTGQLMVQVVDVKEHKVLKEFPPEKLLDTLAYIREYVGILLDKKV